MSRTKVSVKSVYWSLARACGLEPDTAIDANGVSAIAKSKLLRALNTGYDDAYTANEWEDAWESGTLTPTAGVIAFSAIGNASRFTLWSGDPRTVNSSAYPIPFTTDADGITIQTSNVAAVFGFWLPKVAAFTDAESETLSIIDVLASATVDLARAEYLEASDQPQSAQHYRNKGTEKLEQQWQIEFQRVARNFYLKPFY